MTQEPGELPLKLPRGEHYILFDQIASGGMATVHLGLLRGALGFSRVVAVKRLHSTFASDARIVQMMTAEARVASQIRHVNVVPTLDVIVAKGELFVVMEYVRGTSLFRLLSDAKANSEAISLDLTVATLTGALRGLHAAHEALDLDGAPLGVVHRDVSPHNILVGVGGIPRIIDFGVAKALGTQDLTKDGEFKGKLAYAAPEQLSGEAVSPRTDVFAAGIVLWEMLTGARLFLGTSDIETFRNVVDCVVPDIRDFMQHSAEATTAIVPVVRRALERDPSKRYPTAEAMALDLGRAHPSAASGELGGWVRRAAAEQLAREHLIVSSLERRSRELEATSPGEENDTRRIQLVDAAREAPRDPSHSSPEGRLDVTRFGARSLAVVAGAAALGSLVGTVAAFELMR